MAFYNYTQIKCLHVINHPIQVSRGHRLSSLSLDDAFILYMIQSYHMRCMIYHYRYWDYILQNRQNTRIDVLSTYRTDLDTFRDNRINDISATLLGITVCNSENSMRTDRHISHPVNNALLRGHGYLNRHILRSQFNQFYDQFSVLSFTLHQTFSFIWLYHTSILRRTPQYYEYHDEIQININNGRWSTNPYFACVIIHASISHTCY